VQAEYGVVVVRDVANSLVRHRRRQASISSLQVACSGQRSELGLAKFIAMLSGEKWSKWRDDHKLLQAGVDVLLSGVAGRVLWARGLAKPMVTLPRTEWSKWEGGRNSSRAGLGFLLSGFIGRVLWAAERAEVGEAHGDVAAHGVVGVRGRPLGGRKLTRAGLGVLLAGRMFWAEERAGAGEAHGDVAAGEVVEVEELPQGRGRRARAQERNSLTKVREENH
jgi:hypothetical protein